MTKIKEEKTTKVATKMDITVMTKGDVPALLAKVTESIKALKGDMPEVAKTTGSLPGFGMIKDIKTVESLIKAHSSVVGKQQAYNKSASEILPVGTKKPPFMLNGSIASAWITDIKGRINIVANKTKLDKLTQIKTTLESHLSEKDKLAKDLAAIANLIEE